MSRYALLVGINDYGSDSGLNQLRYAEADAAALGRVLQGRCGFRTKVLLGGEATGRAVEEALHKSGQGEIFVFFFAGHGQEIRGQYNLHPVDSTASGIGALPFEKFLRHWQYGFGYEKVLAMLDACRNEFSGQRGARGFHSSRDIQPATAGESWVEVLFGCRDGEVSYEDEQLGHGVFTKGLLETLGGQGGELDTDRLAGATGDWMTDWCRRDAQGRRQRANRHYNPSLERKIVLVPGELRPLVVGAIDLAGATALVSCPLCGKKNREEETFRCRGCNEDHLCLRHQDSKTYECERCVGGKGIGQSKSWTEPFTGMEFVFVSGGEYEMGDIFGRGDRPDELPVHYVQVDDFMMGKYPVTQGEWEKVMGNNPSRFKKLDLYPVENVSWDDCQEFIKKLNAKTGKNFRLPTEAEWEYAARSGGKKVKYAETSNGDYFLSYYAWHSGNSNMFTHRVGEKKPNDLGLHDMSGNVREWCQDWYRNDYYQDSPMNNPQGPSSGSCRVVRGGGYYDSHTEMRAGYRALASPKNKFDCLGLRLIHPV